jgi:UDP-2,3-diacylglucosamine hydrolase
MNEAVFISDLHLHPEQPEILEKFRQFLIWAKDNTRTLYILGDFLHVWAGDDDLNAWSEDIATLLANLAQHQISVFFMPGNRDFLIGHTFLKKANMQLLPDPTLIHLGSQAVLLSHGDAYCTQDWSHQYFRCLTRNRWFRWVFLKLPHAFRHNLVNQIRSYSQNNTQKSLGKMDTVPAAMHKDIQRFSADVLIHGHTHRPGLRKYDHDGKIWDEFTLSDWDENPQILCYNKSEYRFMLIHEGK